MASPTTWAGHEVSRHNLFTVSPLGIQCDHTKNVSRGCEPIPIDQKLMDLADNLLILGQIQPITVVNIGKETYEVQAGYRRYEAARYLVTSGKAPDFKLKCTTSNMTNKEAVLVNLSENLQKEDPKPIQLAKGINILLVQHGMTKDEVSVQLSRSRGWVDYHVGLLALPPSVQSAVDVGELPVTAAVEIAKLDGDEAQEKALEEMRDSGDLSAEAARGKRRESGAKVKRGWGP